MSCKTVNVTDVPIGKYRVGRYSFNERSFKLYKSVKDAGRYGGNNDYWDNNYIPEDDCTG